MKSLFIFKILEVQSPSIQATSYNNLLLVTFFFSVTPAELYDALIYVFGCAFIFKLSSELKTTPLCCFLCRS